MLYYVIYIKFYGITARGSVDAASRRENTLNCNLDIL